MVACETTIRASVILAGLISEGTESFVLVKWRSMNERTYSWFMEVRMIAQSAVVSGLGCVAWEMALSTVIVVVGVEVGCQNIGPTSIVILCDVIVISDIFLGGASTSPSNPTGIGGAIGNH
jgi:hypothetical protein